MRNRTVFNDKWRFVKNSSDITAVPETAENIKLPHTWNAVDGQDGGNDYFRGNCVYFKQFEKSSLPENDKHFLEINGANSSATVYLNGQELAVHHGGYSTWRVELTDHLKDSNDLAIVVDNAANEFVYPQTADFTLYGGIYRDINIISVNNTHFDLEYWGGNGLKITPVMKNGNAEVEIEVFAKNLADADEFFYEVTDASGTVVFTKTTKDNMVGFTIEQPHLWHGSGGSFPIYSCSPAPRPE